MMSDEALVLFVQRSNRLEVMEGLVIQLVNAALDNPELGAKDYEIAFSALRLMIASDPRYKPGLCLGDYLGEDGNIASSKKFEDELVGKFLARNDATEIPDDALICLLDDNDQEFRWFGRFLYADYKEFGYIEIPQATCSYWTNGFGVIIPRLSGNEILFMIRFEAGMQKAFIQPTDQPRVRVPIAINMS